MKKINYVEVNNCILPNLKLNESCNKPLNKYGLLRLDYLKNHKRCEYFTLLMKETLYEHLLSVSAISEKILCILMKNYIKNDNRLSEKNKKINQLEWIGLMNNYKNMAEEIIFNEIINK